MNDAEYRGKGLEPVAASGVRPAGQHVANLVPRGRQARGKSAIASLYYTIASQRVLDRPVALQFVASNSKAGTSLVAGQFAAFASRVQGGSSLLIDCASTAPNLLPGQDTKPGLLEAFAADGRIDAALDAVEDVPGLHVARLSNHPDAAFQAGTHLVPAILDQARNRFQFTALDTPALEESAFTLSFSRVSDGVVLIVEADSTKSHNAEATVEAIERSGGKLLGLVFNKPRLYMPRWLYRRL